MKLKNNFYVLFLAATIIAVGIWYTDSIDTSAKAWSSADQYLQTYQNNHSTAEWTYKAFH